MRSLTTIAPVVLSAVLGCSGSTADVGGSADGGADSASAVSADQAATDAANALCARYDACAPLYMEAFGGKTTCATRMKGTASAILSAPGTSTTPATLEACAQAIAGATCADVLGRSLPDVCRAKPGALADGAACGDDGQCKGTRCKIPANGTCGTCGAPSAVGGACAVDDDCAPGLACTNQACAKYRAEGEVCDAARPCRPDLACSGGACVARKAVGDACTSDPDICDNLHGAFCNATSGKCEAVTFTPSGTCGLVASHLVACSGAGATCRGIAPPMYQGTCVAGAADGTACDEANGPKCQAPAVCSGGTCKLVDPAACK